MGVDLSIDALELPRSIIVLRGVGGLKSAEISTLFDGIGKGRESFTEHHRTIRQARPSVGGRYSLLVFDALVRVSFAPKVAVRDRQYCFALLLETDELAALLTKSTGSLLSRLPSTLEPLGYSETLNLFAAMDARYESINLRTLGVAKEGLLRRSYGAYDLQSVMPRAGSRRSAATTLKVSRGGVASTLSPGSGRVSQIGGRVGVKELFAFLKAVENELSSVSPKSSFLDSFAQPIGPKSLPSSVVPTTVLWHWLELEELMMGGVLKVGEADATTAEREALRDLLTSEVTIDPVKSPSGEFKLSSPLTLSLGSLRPTATKFTLESASLSGYSLWYPDHEISLERLINEEHAFTVTFSDPTYSYSRRSLFLNRRLPEELSSMLSCFEVKAELAQASSEKGDLTRTSTKFSKESVFGIIEAAARLGGAIVICDDLGDEWADHIVLRTGAGREIEFIHSKWKGVTGTSASAFHDVIGQATKNLGNLSAPGGRFAEKCRGVWRRNYSGPGVRTAIPRLRSKHDPSDCLNAHATLRADINTRLTMSVAVSFLSKASLTTAANSLRQGKRVRPNVIQLMWILAGFIDNCRANGVHPRVYCAK